MQPWMLWALLWTADSYTPSDSARHALSLDSSGLLLANDFVKMLLEAASNAGVPASWPDIALDAEKAKFLMDVEHARILLWKGWACNKQRVALLLVGTVHICGVDDHKLKFQASFGQCFGAVWTDASDA